MEVSRTKDGDRAWLPLDSPDVEILEGRYRIVARFAQADTEVQIRICHLAIAEDPPKRRFQKRFSRTNADGLMVVVPYLPCPWHLGIFLFLSRPHLRFNRRYAASLGSFTGVCARSRPT